jgi:hypothetical protein
MALGLRTQCWPVGSGSVNNGSTREWWSLLHLRRPDWQLLGCLASAGLPVSATTELVSGGGAVAIFQWFAWMS